MFSNRAKRLGVRCDQCFLCGMDRILCGSALASISFVTRPLLTFLMTVAQRHEDAKLSVDAVYIKSCTHFLSPANPEWIHCQSQSPGHPGEDIVMKTGSGSESRLTQALEK